LSNLATLPDHVRELKTSLPYHVQFSEGISRLRESIEAEHARQA
jgi:hypothetical protein